MSATNSPTKRGRPGTDGEADADAVLAALDDPACRAILEATSEESLTATELSEQCDIPTSTAYRKVEKLSEADLVEERIRINTSGKHAAEYRRSFDDVLVSIDGGEIDIELTKPEGEALRATEPTSGEAESETDVSTTYAVADD